MTARGHFSAQACDTTLIEWLGRPDLTHYDVSHVRDLKDLQRVQSFCDAFNLDARWKVHRNGHQHELTVERPAGQVDGQLELIGATA